MQVLLFLPPSSFLFPPDNCGAVSFSLSLSLSWWAGIRGFVSLLGRSEAKSFVPYEDLLLEVAESRGIPRNEIFLLSRPMLRSLQAPLFLFGFSLVCFSRLHALFSFLFGCSCLLSLSSSVSFPLFVHC